MDDHSLAGLAPLLADEVQNKALKTVELVGVETTGSGDKSTSQTVYDLQLSDVRLTSLKNNSSSQGVGTQLAFSYGSGKLSDSILSKRQTSTCSSWHLI